MHVNGTALGSAEGRMVYEPDHPLADAEGYVRTPTSTWPNRWAQLIMAQRGYQANAQRRGPRPRDLHGRACRSDAA